MRGGGGARADAQAAHNAAFAGTVPPLEQGTRPYLELELRCWENNCPAAIVGNGDDCAFEPDCFAEDQMQTKTFGAYFDVRTLWLGRWAKEIDNRNRF